MTDQLPAVVGPDRAHWLELPASRASVRAARRGVGERLGAWRMPAELCGDAVLLVSELVTNAVVHTFSARILCGVALLPDGSLRVEVHDDDPATRRPAPGRPCPDDESGRGLCIVRELADSWGTGQSTRTGGNAVWATLRAAY
ncbi:ATP-binding protein [Streptomyces sp. MS06]|uniref:ATP-binding protein n=1 Tax=Streptomyces sp. MS06 TaxID=3385974 RepID=UPI0039A141D9